MDNATCLASGHSSWACTLTNLIVYQNWLLKSNCAGQWSSALPACQKIECPLELEGSDHRLEYEFSNNSYLGTARFSCPYGFRLLGPRVATCQKNMTWHPSAPTCQGIPPLLRSRADSLNNWLCPRNRVPGSTSTSQRQNNRHGQELCGWNGLVFLQPPLPVGGAVTADLHPGRILVAPFTILYKLSNLSYSKCEYYQSYFVDT